MQGTNFDWQTNLDDLGIYSNYDIKLLNSLGISNLLDVLLYLPIRYEDKTHITPIKDARVGDKVLIQARVISANYIKNRARNYQVWIDDGNASMALRFIKIFPDLQKKLLPSAVIRAYGEVRQGFNSLEIIHPQIIFLHDEKQPLDESLTPIYSTTAKIRQKSIRDRVKKALNYCAQNNFFNEVLPKNLLAKYALPDILTALQIVHFPSAEHSKQELLDYKSKAQLRLIFEELLARQLYLQRKRQAIISNKAYAINFDAQIEAKFLQSLPFKPTGAQLRAGEDIKADIKNAYPMLRLVQGDVGSGKTLVAALAILQVVQAGLQAALMAPTEILATQHYNNFKNWLENLGFNVVFLGAKLKAKQKREVLQQISAGEANLVIGTHAIIQKDVIFKNLALSVIDEQHRFGVAQREELFSNAKGQTSGILPHQLIMTATPIPRTLAMSIYADLELSILDELPAGRKAIQTFVMPLDKREELIQRLRRAKGQGMQIFWVCALVAESEALNCQAAEDTFEELKSFLTDFKIGLVHGKQKPPQRETTMQEFRAGSIDLLVSTTVIEVGVDIPNAGVMIIDNAERFGLSQLHQLRGRIGRGNKEAFCILLYKKPLSEISGKRLAVIRNNTDGFKIAEADLKLRGEGDMLGKLQSGRASFRIADIFRDYEYLQEIRQIQLGDLAQENILQLLNRWKLEVFYS